MSDVPPLVFEEAMKLVYAILNSGSKSQELIDQATVVYGYLQLLSSDPHNTAYYQKLYKGIDELMKVARENGLDTITSRLHKLRKDF